jgi:hypothetical protein
MNTLLTDKAIALITANTVEGQLDSELRASVSELLNRASKELIEDVGEEVCKAVEVSMQPTYVNKLGKTILNPEYMSLTEAIAIVVVKLQNAIPRHTFSASVLLPNGKGSRIEGYYYINDFGCESVTITYATIPNKYLMSIAKHLKNMINNRIDSVETNAFTIRHLDK